MKLKELIVLLLVVCITVTLAACGGGSGVTTTAPDVTTTAPEVTTTEAPATTTAPVTTTAAPVTTTAPVETTTAAPEIINPLDDTRFEVGSKDAVYEFTAEDEARINEKIDRLEAMLVDCADYEAFEALYEDVSEVELEYMLTQRSLAHLYYSLTPYNGTPADDYEYMSEYYTSTAQRLIVMYRTIYDSPFKDKFYEEWPEEEIEEALAMAEQYTDEMIALIDEKNDLVREYDALSETEFSTGAREIYVKVVEINNRIAKLAGYDNYMDYAYKNVYGREYTPEDSHVISENVIKYIIPAMDGMVDSFYARFYALAQRIQIQITNSLYGNYEKYGHKIHFDKFAELVGGDYLETYNALWDGGIYFFAKSEEVSLPQAYTTYLYDYEAPALYFGPGYDSIGTVVHEFGHYYAYTTLGELADEISYDLAEVHSQGNEWIFYSMLDTYMSEEKADVIVQYDMLNALQSILLCTLVNEFEIAVYEAENLTPEALDGIFDTICEPFGGRAYLTQLMDYDPNNYWPYVVVANDAYYISYAMSLIPSLELYAHAEQNVEHALDIYEKLTHIDPEREDITFTTIITEAGLYGPFSEEAYKAIGEAANALK